MIGVEEKEVNILLLHLQKKEGNNSMLKKENKYLFGILDDLFLLISCFIFFLEEFIYNYLIKLPKHIIPGKGFSGCTWNR